MIRARSLASGRLCCSAASCILATVLLLPNLATQDAYARVLRDRSGQRRHAVPAADAGECVHAVHGPSFRLVGMPLRSLAVRRLKFSVPISPAYTSVSFYTRADVAYYAINDRAAGRRVDRARSDDQCTARELPENEEITAADRLIVTSPTTTGLIVISALAPEPGWTPAARSALAAARCRPQ